MKRSTLFRCAVLLLLGGCEGPATAPAESAGRQDALDSVVSVTLGSPTTPQITAQRNTAGPGFTLRFTSRDASSQTRWTLQRLVGSTWTAVATSTDQTTFTVSTNEVGVQYRVRACIGTSCSAYSLPVTVTVTTPS